MHEISLCQSILKIIEQQAAQQNFSCVKTVFLEVGRLAGVEPDALRFGFDAVMKGSMVEGARLEIIDVSGLAVCLRCNNRVDMKQRFDACPACGDIPLLIEKGEELRVKELEVE